MHMLKFYSSVRVISTRNVWLWLFSLSVSCLQSSRICALKHLAGISYFICPDLYHSWFFASHLVFFCWNKVEVSLLVEVSLMKYKHFNQCKDNYRGNRIAISPTMSNFVISAYFQNVNPFFSAVICSLDSNSQSVVLQLFF
jgi:hypothetical protein